MIIRIVVCYRKGKKIVFYTNKCDPIYKKNFMIIFLQGRSGEIKHLYRSFAFLLSRMMTENGGYFVCKTRHLVQAGGAKVSKLLKYIWRLLKLS